MSVAEQLLEHIDRYFDLRQYGDDPVFRRRLANLQASQAQRLTNTHQHLLDNPRSAPAVQFLLDEVYSGKDLRPVAHDIRRATRKAMGLLPESVMSTSAAVMEATLITQELDEAMTELMGDALDQPPGLALYSEGYRSLGREDDRRQQLALIGELGHGIDRYVRSRLIQTTFRMVRKPAHAAGFSNLYDFLQQGFGVLKPVPSVGDLLAGVAEREAEIMVRLFAGHSLADDGRET